MQRQHGSAHLYVLLVLMLLACIGAVTTMFVAPRSSSIDGSHDANAHPDGSVIPDAEGATPVASVQGQVFLEVLAAPTDEVVPEEDAPAQPPAIELGPPKENTCRIRAWQKGTLVSDVVSCDAEGRFDVPVSASGRTAFEIEIPGRLRAVLEADVPEGGRGRLPPVALGLAESIRGQVVDRRGQPVANVTVEAMPTPNLGEPEPWRATTDTSGNFVLDTLPPGPVSLRCAAPGFTPTIVEAIAPQDEVLLVLDGLLDLKGRVIAGPIDPSRIAVRIEGSGIWPARSADVDAEGRFVFPTVPDGVYAVEAVAEATPEDPREFASIPLENVSPDLEVTLALVPAMRVQVKVVSPNGAPVVGARVTLMSSQVGLLGRTAQTDAEGRAAPGPVVPGPWVLRADADGFLPSESIALTIDEAGIPEQTLVLSLPGRIEGIVVDADGKPVPQAFVSVTTDALWTVGEGEARADAFRTSFVATGTLGVTKGPVPEIPIWGRDDPEPVGNARADDDGRFALRDLAPGEYTLQALHGDFAASEAVTLRVRAGSVHSGVVLVLRSGMPLTGRVVDGNGRPIASASVELDDGSSYVTDRRGTFHAGLRRGTQVLVARYKRLAPARLEVRMHDSALDVELVLHEAKARLHGRVEDGNGRPIENAQITVHMSDGLYATRVDWTDDRGLWSIDDLPEGEAELDVEHGDFLPVTLEVVASKSPAPLDVELEDGWWVEIDVRTFGTDDPIGGASIVGDGLHARTDRNGHARLGPLGGEKVRLEIQADGFPPKHASVQKPSGSVAEIAVDLVEGGSLTGIVTDYRGDPVPGSRVMVRDADTDDLLADVHTGVGGRFRVDGIPEGELLLEAFPPSSREDELAEVAQSSDVLRGRVTADVELRFDRR